MLKSLYPAAVVDLPHPGIDLQETNPDIDSDQFSSREQSIPITHNALNLLANLHRVMVHLLMEMRFEIHHDNWYS